MFILRLSLLACVFYLAATLVIQAAVLALLYGTGGFSITFIGRGGIAAFTAFFGLIWLVSFLLAFRVVFPHVWARFVG